MAENLRLERQGPGGPSGLQSRKGDESRSGELGGAGSRITAFCGRFLALVLGTTLRWGTARSVRAGRACSAVQRRAPLSALVEATQAALLMVARAGKARYVRQLKDRDAFQRPRALLSVSEAMRRFETSMEGFEVADRELAAPLVPLATEVKERVALALCAIVAGATPEALATYLDEGFPSEVSDALERAGERDEMFAHIDLLTNVLQMA